MPHFRDLRNKQNLSQKQVASMLAVDRTTVTKWEAGVTKPRLVMLPQIANVLKCTVEEIVESITYLR